MEEQQEFYVGKRMPDFGKLDDWLHDVAEEPMPIRFNLVSICEHPAFAASGVKQDCMDAHADYCSDHLTLLDPEMSCEP